MDQNRDGRNPLAIAQGIVRKRPILRHIPNPKCIHQKPITPIIRHHSNISKAWRSGSLCRWIYSVPVNNGENMRNGPYSSNSRTDFDNHSICFGVKMLQDIKDLISKSISYVLLANKHRILCSKLIDMQCKHHWWSITPSLSPFQSVSEPVDIRKLWS